MTIKQVQKILAGQFESPADRIYWEDVLKKLEIKEQTARGNKQYFQTMRIYDR